MTIKKYLDDAYTWQFSATIAEVIDTTDPDVPWIVLDETYFYPEGGGQPCDLGKLAGYPVVDVQITEGKVHHKIKLSHDLNAGLPSIKVGLQVECVIDHIRRRDFMCQHSGQHVLSAVLERLYQTATVGFHLTEDNLTIDTNTILSEKSWQDIELIVNEWVREALAFKVIYPESDSLDQYDLRKQPKVTSDIRLVALADRDAVPCGGTHVHHTGEIGTIKIERVDKYKAGQRIYFCCGRRALISIQLESTIAKTMCNHFSVPTNQVLSAFEQILEKQKILHLNYQRLVLELAKIEAKSLIDKVMGEKYDLNSHFSPLVALWDDQRDAEQMKALIGALTLEKSYSGAILIGYKDDKGAQFVLRAPLGVNANEVLNALKGHYELRGGGSPERIQAGSQNVETVKSAYDWCINHLSTTYGTRLP